jgi:hypothetical protein
LKYQGSTNCQPGLQDLGISQKGSPSVMHLQQAQFKLENDAPPLPIDIFWGHHVVFKKKFLS